MRMALFAMQRGVCPGCGFYQPHYLRFEVDHIVMLADDWGLQRNGTCCCCAPTVTALRGRRERTGTG